MHINNLLMRAVYKYRRTSSKYLYRRMAKLQATTPTISFSFDDAPHSAFTQGGDILNSFGTSATYYISLGKLGSDSPSGPIASLDDLRRAVKEGHELGCHTFDHKNSWETKPSQFVESVLKNRQVLSQALPEITFETLAYPICGPRPATKRIVGRLFKCCRGGGQTFNCGETDLNYLKAFFLDFRNGDSIDVIRKLVERNMNSRGWLIFATHDISNSPSPFGCSISFFREVVAHAVNSGSRILPICKAYEQLIFDKPQNSNQSSL